MNNPISKNQFSKKEIFNKTNLENATNLVHEISSEITTSNIMGKNVPRHYLNKFFYMFANQIAVETYVLSKIPETPLFFDLGHKSSTIHTIYQNL